MTLWARIRADLVTSGLEHEITRMRTTARLLWRLPGNLLEIAALWYVTRRLQRRKG